MKTFLIAGDIIGNEDERTNYDDVCPSQIDWFLRGLEEGEEFTLEITSWGGDVAQGGLAICNMIRKASLEGHRSTAHVIGVAASMASAIACSCDKLTMDSNAFMMIHLPWTVTQGNAPELRKQAETLDQMTAALLAIYRTKFDASDETILKMLADETWIMGAGASVYGLQAEIIETEQPLKIAACGKRYAKMPKILKDRFIMDETKETVTETVKETVKETVTETTTETVAEEQPTEEQPTEEQPTEEQPTEEQPETEQPAEEETVSKAEADRRVSGMQAKMQKQINALHMDYRAQVEDLKNQLDGKSKELATAKADATRLAETLESVKAELSKVSAELTEKNTALAQLAARTLSPSEELPTLGEGLARCKTLKEKSEFIGSGKFRKS